MNPYSTYGKLAPSQDAREQEALAFRLASRRLTEARDRTERNLALNINHEMWSIVFRELNGPSCLLPDILKGDCIRLAYWSITYSTKAVLSDLPLNPLIEINNAVAEGLEAPSIPPASLARNASQVGVAACA